MMKKILFGICILFILSGCDTNENYSEQGRLIKMSDECLKEMICQIPNSSEEITFSPELLAHEMCYDLINDPDNIREEVNKVFEEHPDNWEEYIDWTPHKLDPKITFIPNNNITEITCEKIYVKRNELK